MPTIGLTADVAQEDRPQWLFHLDGVLQEGWDWTAGPPPLRRLAPARRTTSGRLSRNIPVQSWSMTTGSALFLESGLEHELAMWLDRQQGVAWLVAQPAKLVWPDGKKHFPDLLSLDSDGQVTVWDARHEQRRGKNFVEVAERTARECALLGWGYELFGGLDVAASLICAGWPGLAVAYRGWKAPAPC